MKPATRSGSGAAMVAGSGASKAGSKDSAAGSARIQQQQVATKLVGPPKDHSSRSRAGPARVHTGRFTRGGSMVAMADPAQVLQDQVVAVPAAAVDRAQMATAEEDEVSNFQSMECERDSSSGDSESHEEEEGMLEEHLGQGSSLANETVGLLADQLFVELPQPIPCAAGRILEGAAAVGNTSRPRAGAALEVDGGELKGKAKLVEEGSVLPRSCLAAPQVKLGGDVPARGHMGAGGAAQMASWVNLFKDNRNPSKGIMLEDKEVDGEVVMLDEEDVDTVEEAWGHCLVGLFAGRFPGMAAVHKLTEGWKVNCSQRRHRSGWIIFKFQSDEDRLKVLNGGPYFAYGSNLLLKILPSCFRFEGEDVASVPIWIQLPGLPLDCWNARALSKIVSKVGKPITTDNMTRTKERISFARVLVEVDVRSEIVSSVEIGLPTGVVYQQSVIPEFSPKFCKRCKTFGHVEKNCGKGLDERQHKAYVAKKKSLSDTPVVEVQVGPSVQVHVPADLAREKIQAWLMSGPKVVQDAAEPKVRPVPKGTRVKEVLSAFATALGVTVEFTGAASSEDLRDGGAGNSDEVRAGGGLPVQLGADLQPVIVADSVTNCPELCLNAGLVDGADPTLCPGESMANFEHGEGAHCEPAVKGPARKNLWPDVGLDGSSVGWNMVGRKGKKGRRK